MRTTRDRRDRLYALAGDLESVVVVDTTTNSIVSHIAIGPPQPGQAAAFPLAVSEDYLFIANKEEDTVMIVDLATETVVRTILVGDGPEALAVSAEYLYVLNSFDETLSVIDLAGLPTPGDNLS